MRCFVIVAGLVFTATQSTGCPAATAAENLKIKFDDKGLASIVHNGVELVNPADGRFTLQSVQFKDPAEKSGVRQIWQPKPTRSSFDATTKTLLREYDWGKVQCSSRRMRTGWTCGSR